MSKAHIPPAVVIRYDVVHAGIYNTFITIKSAILRLGASGLATFTITIERDHDLSHFLARPEYKQPI